MKALSLALFSVFCVISVSWGFTSSRVSRSAAQRKPNPEALKKYAGRYQLEVGLIPISTLDVSLENDTLWIKPSLLKKRKLIHKSKTVFVDEIDGKRYTFAKNEEGNIVSVTFEYEGGDHTAQRVLLPPPSLKGNTAFRLKGYPEATIVILTGSFNNWNQSQFVFGREGDEWICRIDLDLGTYTYKFIVDGNWLLDPTNANTEEDAAGNVNSVLVKQNLPKSPSCALPNTPTPAGLPRWGIRGRATAPLPVTFSRCALIAGRMSALPTQIQTGFESLHV